MISELPKDHIPVRCPLCQGDAEAFGLHRPRSFSVLCESMTCRATREDRVATCETEKATERKNLRIARSVKRAALKQSRTKRKNRRDGW